MSENRKNILIIKINLRYENHRKTHNKGFKTSLLNTVPRKDESGDMRGKLCQDHSNAI